jgi:hypothetical protein
LVHVTTFAAPRLIVVELLQFLDHVLNLKIVGILVSQEGTALKTFHPVEFPDAR